MTWDTITRLFSNTNLPWLILWLGLFVLIVGLIVLMRTHWGQSNPLRKCAVLSLLVHLVLAVYATTVEIVTVAAGPSGIGGGNPCSVSLVGGDTGDSLIEGTDTGKSPRPWDRVPVGPAVLPMPQDLARTDVPPAPDAARVAADMVKDSGPAATRLPSDVVPGKTFEIADDKVGPPKQGPTTATPIEEVAPQKAAAVEPVAPKTMPPDRMAIEPMQPLKSIDPNAHSVTEPSEQTPLVALPSSFALPRDIAEGTTPPRTTGAAKVDAIPDPFVSGGQEGTAPQSATWANTTPAANPAAAANIPGTANPEALVPIPAPFKNRTAPDHGGAVRRGGGSSEAEAAVQAALEWLAANQSADGRWEAKRFGAGVERNVLGNDRHGAGAKADTGVTGLALLAFLGSGNTHKDGKYATNVRKGLEFIMNSQGRDGSLGGEAETFAFMYCHGMATLSLSEAYAMTHDNRLEPFVTRAIDFTLSMQHPQTGGWRYQPGDTGDTSQLGWQMMSLKSAELAGIPMSQRTRDGMVRFLKSVTSGPHQGRASYRPGERTSRTMTAEALVCRQFLGMERTNPASDEAGDFVMEELPGKGKLNLYYWYYASLSMYQLQGEYWRKWNDALQPALLKSQETAGNLRGSWSPDDDLWGGYGGRVYSTAMGTLCLEVYYRYLPLYGEPVGQDKK